MITKMMSQAIANLKPNTVTTSVNVATIPPCNPCYHPNFFTLSEPLTIISNATLLPLDANVQSNWNSVTLNQINASLESLGQDTIPDCVTGFMVRGGGEWKNYPSEYLDTSNRPSGNVFVVNGRQVFKGALNLSRAQNYRGDSALLLGIPLLADRQSYMDATMKHDNGMGLIPTFGSGADEKGIYWINRQNAGITVCANANIILMGWTK